MGEDNIFIFGMKTPEVNRELQFNENSSQDIYTSNAQIRRIIDMLIDGTVCPEDPKKYNDLYQTLIFGDHGRADTYMVVRDFESYCEIHDIAQKQYRDEDLWIKKAIINVAKSGFFSSDRTIDEYNDKIWHLEKLCHQSPPVGQAWRSEVSCQAR